MQRHHTQPRRAFTLVELVVVIVVLGILATLAVFGFRAAVSRSQASALTEAARSFDRQIRAQAGFGTETDRTSRSPRRGSLLLAMTTGVGTSTSSKDIPDGEIATSALGEGSLRVLVWNPGSSSWTRLCSAADCTPANATLGGSAHGSLPSDTGVSEVCLTFRRNGLSMYLGLSSSPNTPGTLSDALAIACSGTAGVTDPTGTYYPIGSTTVASDTTWGGAGAPTTTAATTTTTTTVPTGMPSLTTNADPFHVQILGVGAIPAGVSESIEVYFGTRTTLGALPSTSSYYQVRIYKKNGAVWDIVTPSSGSNPFTLDATTQGGPFFDPGMAGCPMGYYPVSNYDVINQTNTINCAMYPQYLFVMPANASGAYGTVVQLRDASHNVLGESVALFDYAPGGVVSNFMLIK